MEQEEARESLLSYTSKSERSLQYRLLLLCCWSLSWSWCWHYLETILLLLAAPTMKRYPRLRPLLAFWPAHALSTEYDVLRVLEGVGVVTVSQYLYQVSTR